MDNTSRRTKALDKIRSNIERYGYHVYIVTQGVVPRFAYTIGLSDAVGFELVMPGASGFDLAQVREVMRSCGDAVRADRALETVDLQPLGTFRLGEVHETWGRTLLKGARDFYGHDVPARQLVPDVEHLTIDVPDMSREYVARNEPIWCWLALEWPYPVPRDTDALTDMAVLRGARIMGIRRPEPDEWEFLSAPLEDFEMESARMVPLATLLGSDRSLLTALSMPIGSSLWRSDDGWHVWSSGPGSADALFEPSKSQN